MPARITSREAMLQKKLKLKCRSLFASSVSSKYAERYVNNVQEAESRVIIILILSVTLHVFIFFL